MVMNKDFKYPDKAAYEYVMDEFEKKDVKISDIAEIVWSLEHEFLPEITMQQFEIEVDNILHKREVLNNIMVGLYLDHAAEQFLIQSPLQQIIEADCGVFGVDEMLSVAIANIYGSIGVTNFGFLDKAKTGTMARLDNDHGDVNTFIDDIVGAIAAAVAAKMAHATA